MERFARFLRKLDGMKESDGISVLDNSMIVYGCAIGDGNKHNHDELPVALAGGGGGSLQPGRRVLLREQTPMTNLYTAMLDRLGVKAEKGGGTTSQVSGFRSQDAACDVERSLERWARDAAGSRQWARPALPWRAKLTMTSREAKPNVPIHENVSTHCGDRSLCFRALCPGTRLHWLHSPGCSQDWSARHSIGSKPSRHDVFQCGSGHDF